MQSCDEEETDGPANGTLRHRGCRLGVALSALIAFLVVPDITLAQATPASTSPDRQHQQLAFDIPAQPLISALEVYGAISGRQVVYDAELAKGSQSTEISGSFTPDDALRRLLTGTGLAPRYMAADGFVLLPEPAAKRADVNTAPPAAVTWYYGRVQAGLRQTFCANSRTRLGGYRAAVGLWIGSSGTVSRASLLDTTGDSNLDAALDRAIHGIIIGEPPPPGFAQPIIMLITPDMVRDCPPADPNVRRVQAEP